MNIKHLTWAQRLCSQREYCAYDLRLKLKSKGVEAKEAELVIATLTQQNFLNETRYVHAFVHDKSKLQGWGPEKIRHTLRAKQLPDSLICSALAEINHNTQIETLRRLFETKRRSIKATSESELRIKLFRFALSRGFSYEDINDYLCGSK